MIQFSYANFSKNFVFTWDAGLLANGTGDPSLWGGRPLNDARDYPAGGTAGMEVHDAGQLWASVLMQIWDDLGKMRCSIIDTELILFLLLSALLGTLLV